uniref:Probable glycerol kinase n=1 Tax=Diabrotica virgifera virgifera TaxID=50390 RepID=A0A6P7GN93_DIAVI
MISYSNTDLSAENEENSLIMSSVTRMKYGPLIGAIDEGTSSTRFLVFASKTAEVLTYHQVDIPSIVPKEGWFEQDPMVILHAVKETIEVTCDNLQKLNIDYADIVSVGITNQRETTVLWDKNTGQPLCNAIVWMDMRTSSTVDEILKHGKRRQDFLQNICGLPVSTYFSALKIKWMMDNVPEVKKAIDEDRCLFGNIDTWLIWNLTGGVDCGMHITDVTNASRTMLMNIETLKWDKKLCDVFGIPMKILPEIKSSSEIYGVIVMDMKLSGVPIAGVRVLIERLLKQLCNTWEETTENKRICIGIAAMHHPSIPPPQPQGVTPSCRRGAWPRGNVVGYKRCLREMANPRGKQPWWGKGALPHWTDQHVPSREKEDGTKKEKQKGGRGAAGTKKKTEESGKKKGTKFKGRKDGEEKWRKRKTPDLEPAQTEAREKKENIRGKQGNQGKEYVKDEEGEWISSDNESSSADESEEDEQTPNCNARTKLERLQDSVAALEKLMAEVPNTRVAIKQEVDNLRNRSFDYTEEVEESKEKEKVPRKYVCTTSRVDLENPEAIKRRVDAITEKMPICEYEEIAEFLNEDWSEWTPSRKKMAICEYEEIAEFLNEDWPEEVFQRTVVKEWDISEIAADVAVFVTNNDEDSKAMKTVKGMFPDLPGVPAEVDEDGGLGTVRVTMSAHVDGTWINNEIYGFKLLPNKKEELESVKFLKTCRKLGIEITSFIFIYIFSVICGISDETKPGHFVKAALEAVCFQVRDVLEAMELDCRYPLQKLLVDGGMTKNDYLMQMQADYCGIPVVRPTMTETTSLGAAIAAGIAEGVEVWQIDKILPVPCDNFTPQISENLRDIKYSRWKMAIARSLGWAKPAESNGDLKRKIVSAVPAGLFVIGVAAIIVISEIINKP